MITPFNEGGVNGFIHEAGTAAGIALTHGAGGNCDSRLLIAVAGALAAAGITVLRFNLAFREKRRFGPPHPASAAEDRESIRRAIAILRNRVTGPVYAGGHSYGGRQSTMVAAEDPEIAAGLLLLSYPLHPPKRPEQLRTAHFPELRTPAVFVHGANDPFGTIDELRTALGLIAAATRLIVVPGAGHDLNGGRFNMDFIRELGWGAGHIGADRAVIDSGV